MSKRKRSDSPPMCKLPRLSSEHGTFRMVTRSSVIKVEKEEIKVTPSKPVKVVRPHFCWACHMVDATLQCGHCPRIFHPYCVTVRKVEIGWACPECTTVSNAINVPSEAMRWISQEQVCNLLNMVLGHMKAIPGSADFWKTVAGMPPDIIRTPMDLNTLQSNINYKKYSCLEAFLADAKFLLLNCSILQQNEPWLPQMSRKVLKLCSEEIRTIKCCPECYRNAHVMKNWFVHVCREPHLLVWAKMKGFTYWPAKLMAFNSKTRMVDAKFFGSHDRAWVELKNCFIYSKRHPVARKKRDYKLDNALNEIQEHVEKIKKKHETFVYAPERTRFTLDDMNDHLSSMFPNWARRIQHSNMENSSTSNIIENKSENEVFHNVHAAGSHGKINSSCVVVRAEVHAADGNLPVPKFSNQSTTSSMDVTFPDNAIPYEQKYLFTPNVDIPEDVGSNDQKDFSSLAVFEDASPNYRHSIMENSLTSNIIETKSENVVFHNVPASGSYEPINSSCVVVQAEVHAADGNLPVPKFSNQSTTSSMDVTFTNKSLPNGQTNLISPNVYISEDLSSNDQKDISITAVSEDSSPNFRHSIMDNSLTSNITENKLENVVFHNVQATDSYEKISSSCIIVRAEVHAVDNNLPVPVISNQSTTSNMDVTFTENATSKEQRNLISPNVHNSEDVKSNDQNDISSMDVPEDSSPNFRHSSMENSFTSNVIENKSENVVFHNDQAADSCEKISSSCVIVRAEVHAVDSNLPVPVISNQSTTSNMDVAFTENATYKDQRNLISPNVHNSEDVKSNDQNDIFSMDVPEDASPNFRHNSMENSSTSNDIENKSENVVFYNVQAAGSCKKINSSCVIVRAEVHAADGNLPVPVISNQSTTSNMDVAFTDNEQRNLISPNVYNSEDVTSNDQNEISSMAVPEDASPNFRHSKMENSSTSNIIETKSGSVVFHNDHAANSYEKISSSCVVVQAEVHAADGNLPVPKFSNQSTTSNMDVTFTENATSKEQRNLISPNVHNSEDVKSNDQNDISSMDVPEDTSPNFRHSNMENSLTSNVIENESENVVFHNDHAADSYEKINSSCVIVRAEVHAADGNLPVPKFSNQSTTSNMDLAFTDNEQRNLISPNVHIPKDVCCYDQNDTSSMAVSEDASPNEKNLSSVNVLIPVDVFATDVKNSYDQKNLSNVDFQVIEGSKSNAQKRLPSEDVHITDVSNSKCEIVPSTQRSVAVETPGSGKSNLGEDSPVTVKSSSTNEPSVPALYPIVVGGTGFRRKKFASRRMSVVAVKNSGLTQDSQEKKCGVPPLLPITWERTGFGKNRGSLLSAVAVDKNVKSSNLESKSVPPLYPITVENSPCRKSSLDSKRLFTVAVDDCGFKQGNQENEINTHALVPNAENTDFENSDVDCEIRVDPLSVCSVDYSFFKNLGNTTDSAQFSTVALENSGLKQSDQKNDYCVPNLYPLESTGCKKRIVENEEPVPERNFFIKVRDISTMIEESHESQDQLPQKRTMPSKPKGRVLKTSKVLEQTPKSQDPYPKEFPKPITPKRKVRKSSTLFEQSPKSQDPLPRKRIKPTKPKGKEPMPSTSGGTTYTSNRYKVIRPKLLDTRMERSCPKEPMPSTSGGTTYTSNRYKVIQPKLLDTRLERSCPKGPMPSKSGSTKHTSTRCTVDQPKLLDKRMGRSCPKRSMSSESSSTMQTSTKSTVDQPNFLDIRMGRSCPKANKPISICHLPPPASPRRKLPQKKAAKKIQKPIICRPEHSSDSLSEVSVRNSCQNLSEVSVQTLNSNVQNNLGNSFLDQTKNVVIASGLNSGISTASTSIITTAENNILVVPDRQFYLASNLSYPQNPYGTVNLVQLPTLVRAPQTNLADLSNAVSQVMSPLYALHQAAVEGQSLLLNSATPAASSSQVPDLSEGSEHSFRPESANSFYSEIRGYLKEMSDRLVKLAGEIPQENKR